MRPSSLGCLATAAWTVSDIAIFVLKGDVKLQLTNMDRLNILDDANM